MHPFVSWSAAVLVEPMFLRPDLLCRTGYSLALCAIKRRDVWHNREEAHKRFRERSLKSWDPRVIDLYAVRIYSVSDVPSGSYYSAEIWLKRTPNPGLP